ncbi:hypothetical protein ACFL5O_02415 [Myxococcota bacterium]
MRQSRVRILCRLTGIASLGALLAGACGEDEQDNPGAATNPSSGVSVGGRNSGSSGGAAGASAGLTSAGSDPGGVSQAGSPEQLSPEQEAEALANQLAMLMAADVEVASATARHLTDEVLPDAVRAETTSNKALDFSRCAGRRVVGTGGAGGGSSSAPAAAGTDSGLPEDYCYVELDDLELPSEMGRELRFSGRVGYIVDYPNGIYLLADLHSDAPDTPSEIHLDLMVDFFNAGYTPEAADNWLTLRSPERRYSWITNPPTSQLDQLCARYESLVPHLNAGGAGAQLDAGNAASVALDTLGTLCGLVKTGSEYQKPSTSYLMIDELGLGGDQYLGRLALGYAESPESFRAGVEGAVVYWGQALQGVIESVERTQLALKLIDWPVIQTYPRAEGTCLAVDTKDGTVVELAQSVMTGDLDEADWSGLETIPCPLCVSHAECDQGRICDTTISVCVTGCFGNDDCPDGRRCEGAEPPRVAGQCQKLSDLCNPANPNSCETGTCQNGTCVEECTADDTSQCDTQQVCDEHRCVECTPADQRHCGVDQYCLANRCANRCVQNSQCEAELEEGVRMHCQALTGQCVITCNNLANKCLGDQTCTNQVCQEP